jgi:cytochrome oxidase Cu insertion factor (SCO1/SenC/PrrC family)
MKSSALVFWVSLAIVGSAAYGSWVAWRKIQEKNVVATQSAEVARKRFPPPEGPPIRGFTLQDTSGEAFDSKRLKGHVWIGTFFFTFCPLECRQLNQELKNLHDAFKKTDLQFVSITCDPETDTPEVLKDYAMRFEADPNRWHFLTGDFDYIQKIGRDVFLQDVREREHRNSALVIDRNGRIRASVDLLDPVKVAELKPMLKELLKEPLEEDSSEKNDEKPESNPSPKEESSKNQKESA